MTLSQRVAEAMGLEVDPASPSNWCFVRRGGASVPFDPEHDANDRERCVRWLCDHGVLVALYYEPQAMLLNMRLLKKHRIIGTPFTFETLGTRFCELFLQAAWRMRKC